MKCFIEYEKYCNFPIENLPYGVFSTASNPNHRIGVAIGNKILDLNEISHLFTGPQLKFQQDVFKQKTLNNFMALTPLDWQEARDTLQSLLSIDSSLQNDTKLLNKALVAQIDAKMHLPAEIRDYTDFYSSTYHAFNTLEIFKIPYDQTKANWKHFPLGYHGRASSVVISGSPIRRPNGQTLSKETSTPIFGQSKLMDFELEVAFFVGGPPTTLGEPIEINEAHNHIFGFVLMNDWSVRDVQAFELVPLGPFTSKNLGTTISPWVVTALALESFKVDNFKQDPIPFPYLQHSDRFNFDIHLQVDLTPQNTNVSSTICRSNYKYLYWTPKQHIAQHTITGCNLNPGDLIASGTISGKAKGSYGSMVELSWDGTQPLKLLDGSSRCYLEDGDTVTIKGVCKCEEYNVGFGECVGTLLPAKKY